MRKPFRPQNPFGKSDKSVRQSGDICGKVWIEDIPQFAEVWGRSSYPEDVRFLVSGKVSVQRLTTSDNWQLCYQVDASPWGTTKPLILTDDCADPTRCIAETDVTIITVRGLDFDRIFATSNTFRAFVFQAYAQRIVRLIDQITQTPLDTHFPEFRRVGRKARPHGSDSRPATTRSKHRRKKRCTRT